MQSQSLGVSLTPQRKPGRNATLHCFHSRHEVCVLDRCAAHLNMLCQHAIEAFEKFGSYSSSAGTKAGQRRGMLVNYESLPGFIPRVLLPALFGITPSSEWVAAMTAEASQYSKGRGKAGEFKGDSEDKEMRSTEDIQLWGERILGPTYDQLLAISADSILSGNSPLTLLVNPAGVPAKDIRWNVLKSMPAVDISRAASAAVNVSPRANGREVISNPFASNHSSVPFQVSPFLQLTVIVSQVVTVSQPLTLFVYSNSA